MRNILILGSLSVSLQIARAMTDRRDDLQPVLLGPPVPFPELPKQRQFTVPLIAGYGPFEFGQAQHLVLEPRERVDPIMLEADYTPHQRRKGQPTAETLNRRAQLGRLLNPKRPRH